MKIDAVALNGLGELVAGTELRWSMANPQAGTIGGKGVFVAGHTPGVYTEAVQVEAVVPGERGFVRALDLASVVIFEKKEVARLREVKVLQNVALVTPGGRTLMTAQPIGTTAGPVANVIVSWQVMDHSVGEINDTGLFWANGSPGRYPRALWVTARQDLGEVVVTRSMAVDVIITGPLAQAQIHPTLATVASGETIYFSLTGRDESGSILEVSTHWDVVDERVGTIDAAGGFTAGVTPGLYTDAVRATVVHVLPEY